ncbi:unnamed protein product [Nesidiocoris tenuis]|uniref:Uncharacterized protein n=1 Tax=Nesidiocoris tenuis TaxID=355587 RepID=A0A6H5HJQ4_9HEMI|nr:unnamed protein product [Nesidiocoris tenuis]
MTVVDGRLPNRWCVIITTSFSHPKQHHSGGKNGFRFSCMFLIMKIANIAVQLPDNCNEAVKFNCKMSSLGDLRDGKTINDGLNSLVNSHPKNFIFSKKIHRHLMPVLFIRNIGLNLNGFAGNVPCCASDDDIEYIILSIISV